MRRVFLSVVIACCAFSSRPSAHGQVGNDNPTGPSGEFNGSVTTGGSYDPYTGNAVRSVTDLVISGAVGQYGLSFSRTWNTRTPGWLYSHSWSIENIEVAVGTTPTYIVHFPDGRRETFTFSWSDIYYRGGLGIKERFKPWNSSDGLCYLILPDGGKVEFSGIRTFHAHDPELVNQSDWFEYSFTARAIIDPHGLRTALEYYPDGMLKKLVEPAGRSIQLFYTVVGGQTVLDYIKGSDNREVHYTHQSQTFPPGTIAYTLLTGVTYNSYYGGPSDPPLTATYTYRSPNVGSANASPLLAVCDDPMYPGAMKRINYKYRIVNNLDGTPPVYAQMETEANGDGIPVSHLVVVDADTRREERGDGPSRTFSYFNGRLSTWTDFKGIPSSQTRDQAGYVNSHTDGRGNTTNLTNNPLTGAVTQIQFPLTPGDTPPNSPRGTIQYKYGWATCPDANNRDANNPYYLYSVTDEAGHETKYFRDANKRITRIEYPDDSWETFGYDPYGYGLVITHRLKAGGVKAWTYDTRGLMKTYRDPDHVVGNPNVRYSYDLLDRVTGVTDARGASEIDAAYTVNYAYNTRGQVTKTTLPTDPGDGVRHTIVNEYNPNGAGTLTSITDPLGYVTSYTYDDYRRIRTITTPRRSPGDNTPRTISTFYDTFQRPINDYTHADSNPTRIELQSGKLIKALYDANRRRTSVTHSAADGTTDSATTSMDYDNAGNMTMIKESDPQTGAPSAARVTTRAYDERNRVMSILDALSKSTSYKYDAFGRTYSIERPNGQIVRYEDYDGLNRPLRERIIQAPTPDAVTNYTWSAGGPMQTRLDPNGKLYTFEYDDLARLKTRTYPSDSGGIARSESYTYNSITGTVTTYKNRAGRTQTFAYDTFNRPIGFTWDDGYTSGQTMGYDAASRLKHITNADATIELAYYDDNLLKSHRELTGSNYDHTNIYTYDADGNRKSLTYPFGSLYKYSYTGRNQLKGILNAGDVGLVSYDYDRAGNRKTRGLYNGVVTDYAPVDALNRSAWMRHVMNGVEVARFDYAFDEVNRLKYEQRDAGLADGFSYDKSGQVTGFNANGSLSNQVVTGGSEVTSLVYDPAGNRTQVTRNGAPGTWTPNDLNEYTSVSGAPATWDATANLETYDGWTYTYDAQSRLTAAVKGANSVEFWYDGLNRQIARRINQDNNKIVRNVWDGWNLLEERDRYDNLLNYYIHGAQTDEIVVRAGGVSGDIWYTQDGRGNTSHLFDYSSIKERYIYRFSGEPQIFDGSGILKTSSPLKNRFMFSGREWHQELGVYDYRNRFYHPSLGRFMQADPLGFAAGDGNLYRYCGGDSVNSADPSGLLSREQALQNEAINPGGPGGWGDYNWNLGGSNAQWSGSATQGFWSNPDGTPTAGWNGRQSGSTSGGAGNGGGPWSGAGGGGRSRGGSAGSSSPTGPGYTTIYIQDNDTLATLHVFVIGSPAAVPNVAGQWSFLPIITNSPGAMLARATNWIAARHPELRPRQNQPVLGSAQDGRPAGTSINPFNRVITLDPSALRSDAAYVEAFAHELYHVHNGWLKDLFIWFGQGPQQLDPSGFHQRVYQQSDAVLLEYLNGLNGR
jgi:RHS repeat-associated protein